MMRRLRDLKVNPFKKQLLVELCLLINSIALTASVLVAALLNTNIISGIYFVLFFVLIVFPSLQNIFLNGITKGLYNLLFIVRPIPTCVSILLSFCHIIALIVFYFIDGVSDDVRKLLGFDKDHFWTNLIPSIVVLSLSAVYFLLFYIQKIVFLKFKKKFGLRPPTRINRPSIGRLNKAVTLGLLLIVCSWHTCILTSVYFLFFAVFLVFILFRLDRKSVLVFIFMIIGNIYSIAVLISIFISRFDFFPIEDITRMIGFVDMKNNNLKLEDWSAYCFYVSILVFFIFNCLIANNFVYQIKILKKSAVEKPKNIKTSFIFYKLYDFTVYAFLLFFLVFFPISFPSTLNLFYLVFLYVALFFSHQVLRFFVVGGFIISVIITGGCYTIFTLNYINLFGSVETVDILKKIGLLPFNSDFNSLISFFQLSICLFSALYIGNKFGDIEEKKKNEETIRQSIKRLSGQLGMKLVSIALEIIPKSLEKYVKKVFYYLEKIYGFLKTVFILVTGFCLSYSYFFSLLVLYI